MRALRVGSEGLLADLEGKIGVDRFLRLILANGTLCELFHILRHSTAEFSRATVNALTEDAVDTLTEKTIASGRSIGTLNLAMRALRAGSDTLLADLEGKICVGRFQRLIFANGNLPALGRIVTDATPRFANHCSGRSILPIPTHGTR